MAAILIAALVIGVQSAPANELDYRRGDLAYQALVTGDLTTAEKQLTKSSAAYRSDPAWLLNYGHFLARSGRINEASEIFRSVRNAPDVEVVLASGEVIGTREASRRSLKRLRFSGLSSR